MAALDPAAAAVNEPLEDNEPRERLKDVGWLVASPLAVETTAGEVTLPELSALQTTKAYEPPPIVPLLEIFPVAQILLQLLDPPLIIPPLLTVIAPLTDKLLKTTTVPLHTKFPPIETEPLQLKVAPELTLKLPETFMVP